MSYNYPLRYRTFDQLLSDVHVDFQNLSLESMIEPQQLIKVVKRVNYDLGLRINKTKETLLEVEKGRVKLPDDFYILNYALVCDEVSVTQGMPQGTWIEDRPLITPYQMTTPGVISTCDNGTVNCGVCSQPAISCGCTPSVPVCGCNTTPCGCNILLQLPDPCNTSSVTVNTTDTSTSVVYDCCWNSVLILGGFNVDIVINGSNVNVPIASAGTMQAYLNGLGLGTWVVTALTFSRFTFCVDGSATYGNMIITTGGPVTTIPPSCSSDTTIIVTNTSIETCTCGPGCEVESTTATTTASATQSTQDCCWIVPVPDGTTSITVVINGTTFTLPMGGGVPAILTYLNGLNLGVWTLTVSIVNTFTLCVAGNGNIVYGIVTVTGLQVTTFNPTCTTDVINTTVNNVITTCRCNVITPAPIPTPVTTCTTTVDPCVKPRVILNCKNECYELVQIVNPGITRTYKRLIPITIVENPQTVDCGCPNLYWKSPHKAWIRDGWLYTNLDCAVIYISYQGQMEDEDGNLLCPDHDEINEYYEYAVKQRILENLMMNDEPVGRKLELVELRLRAARNYALTIVNTPNFAEMKRVFDANRKAQYGRYYNMFKSYGPLPSIVPTNNFINGYNR